MAPPSCWCSCYTIIKNLERKVDIMRKLHELVLALGSELITARSWRLKYLDITVLEQTTLKNLMKWVVNLDIDLAINFR